MAWNHEPIVIGKAAVFKILNMASQLTANRSGQTLLEKCVTVAQYLQGIGAGGDVASSGEVAVVSRLNKSVNALGRALCIFDVGANKGQFLSLVFTYLTKCKFAIHSFEPSRQTFEELYANVREYGNARVNNYGLGSEPGECDLFYDVVGSQLASLTRRHLTHCGIEMRLSEKVKLETLDRYCDTNHIDYIDLLKLDVEGHELAVLKGATRMLRQTAIGIVTFEFGGCNIDNRTFLKDFFDFFSDYNMRVARITPSGYIRELHSYREIYEQFRSTNFVCYQPKARL